MDKEAVEFVLAALPQGRTVFYDFQDRFAILLLVEALEKAPLSIAAIKQSHLAPLLNKPVVKTLLSQLGRSTLKAEDLSTTWPSRVDGYRLTLSTWPSLSSVPGTRPHVWAIASFYS